MSATDDDVIPHNPSQPFTPRPLIRELLRTRFAVPGAVLLVEGVETVYTSDTARWRTIRVLLGDGELSIQALLGVGTHRYVDTGEVGVGTYVRLEEFVLEDRRLEVEGGGSERSLGEGSARATKPGSGVDRKGKGKDKKKEKKTRRMVCLIVERMVPVGWNRRLLTMAEEWDAAGAAKAQVQKVASAAERQLEKSMVERGVTGDIPDTIEEEEQTLPNPRAEDPGNVEVRGQAYEPKSSQSRKAADNLALETLADMEDDEDDFEVMPVSQERSSQRRKEINITLNSSPSRRPGNAFPRPDSPPADQDWPKDNEAGQLPPRPAPSTQYARLLTQPDQPTALPTTVQSPPTSFISKPPIKITLLKSIPTLPYRQNWSVNVLAVVSAISPLEPSGLSPYSQRQARLTDPSTPKHVLLTVFLDPDEFNPTVGSVVLLLGVKNHMFDGGSLKKYASDRPRAGGGFGVGRLLGEAAKQGRGIQKGQDTWWLEDPVGLSWCDVAGLKKWWVDSNSFAGETGEVQ